MSKTIRVQFSDACTDVLLYLYDLELDVWRTVYGITEAIAPPYADSPSATVARSLHTLHEAALVEAVMADDTWRGWRLTAEGRALVAAAKEADADA